MGSDGESDVSDVDSEDGQSSAQVDGEVSVTNEGNTAESDDSDGTSANESEADSFVRELALGGGILFLGIVAELGISFVAKVLMAQGLTREGYGAVSLGITIMGISSTLVLVGLGTGVGRFLPRYDDLSKRRGVLVSSFQITVPIGFLVGIGLALAAPTIASTVFDNPTVSEPLRLFALAIPLAAFINLVIGGGQGLKDSLPKLLFRHLSLPIARLVGILIVLGIGLGAVGIAWAYLVAYLLVGAMAAVYLLRKTPILSSDVEYEPMHRELLAFSAPLIITRMMAHVFMNFDIFMLGALLPNGTEAAGVYNVVYPLGEFLTISLMAFRFLFLPVISELHAEGDDRTMHRMYQLITKWAAMITLPGFFILVLFPDRVISLTFGAKWLDGAPALVVLSLGFLVHGVAGLNGSALTAIGRTKTIMYDNIVVAVLNVSLNLLLIPPYGFVGAAIATTVSYVVLNVLYSTQLFRSTGVHPFTKALVRPAVLSIALVLVARWTIVQFFSITPLVMVAFALVLFLVYGVIIIRFGGIEDEEIMLVLSFEERFDVDLGPLKSVAETLGALDD